MHGAGSGADVVGHEEQARLEVLEDEVEEVSRMRGAHSPDTQGALEEVPQREKVPAVSRPGSFPWSRNR